VPTLIGIVVPCRNEARVVSRKLANLARQEWPAAERAHAVVVVDDGSTDGTADAAREAVHELFEGRADVRASVVTSDRPPGKAGAIACGLEELTRDGEGCDVAVLTDADVVLEERALAELARAFDDPRLGMASGAQVFVGDLADDGSPRGASGGPPVPAMELFDRATRLVRRLESRRGRLFSVHGQLLAWRASLGLSPSAGVAADDLDLVIAVRRRGLACRLVDGARFLEVKTPRDDRGREQALRRARAYFQAVLRPGLSLGDGAADRIQWWFYTRVPARAPELLAISVLLLLAVAAVAGGIEGAVLLAAFLALVALTPLGREVLFLARVIAATRRREDHAGLSDRWEMERP
jgi:glycosyltransferase involved in cell wall biosynthesis